MKKFLILIFFLLSLTLVKADNSQIQGVELPLSYASVNNSKVEKDTLRLAYKEESNEATRIYIKYDTSAIAENAEIIDAFLNLKTDLCVGEKIDIGVARLTSQWQIDDINWGNKPGFSSPTIYQTFTCNNGLLRWDITEIIKGNINGEYANNGIVIFGPDEVGTGDYNRELEEESSDTYLLVDFQVVTPTPEAQETQEDFNRELLLGTIVFATVVLVAILGYLIYILIKKRKKSKTEKKHSDEDKNENKEAKEINFDEKMSESIKEENDNKLENSDDQGE